MRLGWFVLVLSKIPFTAKGQVDAEAAQMRDRRASRLLRWIFNE
ncbi:hypothetical protein BH20VER1_BH20VER1_00530 [soil metagenome]